MPAKGLELSAQDKRLRALSTALAVIAHLVHKMSVRVSSFQKDESGNICQTEIEPIKTTAWAQQKGSTITAAPPFSLVYATSGLMCDHLTYLI